MDDHDAYCSKWAYIPMTNSLTHWLKTCSWFIHRGHEPLNGIQVGKAPNFADTAFLVKCLGSFLSNTKAPLQKQHLMILRRLIFRCSKFRQKLEIWAVRCVQQDLISAADLERLLNHKRRDCHRWCIFSNLTGQAGWLILFGMSCLSGVSISNMKMTGHHQSPATYGI